MKTTGPLLLVVASVAAALWWWLGSDAASETKQQNVVAAPAHPLESRPPPQVKSQDGSTTSGTGPSEPYSSPDVRLQFRASNDYWKFAASIIGAARAGDGASQYYLHVAINTCNALYRYYFMDQKPDGRTRIRTLDEAQQLTARPQGSILTPDDVRDLQGRCERIMTTTPPPFGSADEWLATATESGYPLALVIAAMNKALQGRNGRDPGKSRIAFDEARSLVIDALQSKDAEVIQALASPVAFLAGEGAGEGAGEAVMRQWTWMMAAYLREPHGAAMAEWKKTHCAFATQCHQDDTALDLIRRETGNDFDEVERRARELNEKIDAGTLDESDI